MVSAGAFLYPWDVLGDEEAGVRLRDLGIRSVTLAAAYHSTTAITPRHPARRVVRAEHSAVYYPPDPRVWSLRDLRPVPQRWCAARDAFGIAADRLLRAGLEVHAWAVLAHNSRLAQAFPQYAVHNVYGDSYGWALCIAHDAVRDYAATLAAEAAGRPGITGIELESCGWYGNAHLHAHDKTGGISFGEAGQYLMSLCFCTACRKGYQAEDADPDRLAEAVLAALGPLWRGEAHEQSTGWKAVRDLLGNEFAEATLRFRSRAALTFQREVTAAIRAAHGPRIPVMVHADPQAHRTGANVGVDAAAVSGFVDGLVVPGPSLDQVGPLSPGTTLVANLPIVTGMGGTADVAGDARAALASGAHELRFYHAGLASDQDLQRVGVALDTLP